MPSKQSEAVRRRWEAARLAMAGGGGGTRRRIVGGPHGRTARGRLPGDRGRAQQARDVAGAEGKPNGPGTSSASTAGASSAARYTRTARCSAIWPRRQARGQHRSVVPPRLRARARAGLSPGRGDPRDPLASPLHADLTGLGPIYIQVGGDEETLLDDARQPGRTRQEGTWRRRHHRLQTSVSPGMLHTFQMGGRPRAGSRRRHPQDGHLGPPQTRHLIPVVTLI